MLLVADSAEAEARSVRFIASRKQKQFQVKLCGISANSDESKEYLRSLLNKGDGSVVVNPVRTEWGVTIAEVIIHSPPTPQR